MPRAGALRRAGSTAPPEVAGAALHPMIALKLWENPCWFTFRINFLGLRFNLPVYGWIEQRYGLLRPEFAVLYALGLRDAIAAKDVCASTGFPKNTISRSIQKLLRRRLIRRAADAQDRRSYILRLSAEGRRILDESVPLMVARERRMLARLSRQEQQTLAALLARLVEDVPNWPAEIAPPAAARGRIATTPTAEEDAG
ncbi:MAG: winged helix-turn-helix transcriptional regulator [Alphaproteobacteria bacterium]|nr:winged helix-turn-helix transcriptional regulator [Alphaproteobacteria bacterium]